MKHTHTHTHVGVYMLITPNDKTCPRVRDERALFAHRRRAPLSVRLCVPRELSYVRDCASWASHASGGGCGAGLGWGPAWVHVWLLLHESTTMYVLN